MAKAKAKHTPFSLKNFLIMFVAIGTIVGLAFWVGRVTQPKAAPSNWPQQVAFYSGQALNRTQNFGSVLTAFYCTKSSNTYVNVNNYYARPNEFLVTKYVSNAKRAQSFAYSITSTANLVSQYCRY